MITKSRRRQRSRVFSTALIILFLGLAAFLMISILRIQKKRQELRNQIVQLESEIAALEKKTAELKKGISSVSEKEYLEKIAREKFLLKKKGEEVIVVSPPEEKEETEQAQPSFWQSIFEKLRSRFAPSSE